MHTTSVTILRVVTEEIKVIVFVGMPGAGKSSCVDFLTKKGIPSVYFGGITLDEIKARGLEINAENERIVREDLRANAGKDVYAKRIIQKIEGLKDDGHKIIVADGLYSWTEYKAFKEHFNKNALIIAIAAPRKLRHKRLAGRPKRPLTEVEVSNREYAEIENIEKGGPIANADYTIVNDSDISQLLNSLEKVLQAAGVQI